jgi:hypothetical protein
MLADEAWRLGQSMDLSGCHYGPATWANNITITRPSPYYYFLAGFAALIGARSVMEVGTHYGGSGLAMAKGLQHANPDGSWRIVTVDVTDLNRDRLLQEGNIVKLVGSATDPATQSAMLDALQGDTIDLLYIDALKSGTFILDVLTGLASRATISWVILDDISKHPSMKQLWGQLEATFAGRCLNLAAFNPNIRDVNVGFGLLEFGQTGLEKILHVGEHLEIR